MSNNRDDLSGRHSNFHIPMALGSAVYYRMTGNETNRLTAHNFSILYMITIPFVMEVMVIMKGLVPLTCCLIVWECGDQKPAAVTIC